MGLLKTLLLAVGVTGLLPTQRGPVCRSVPARSATPLMAGVLQMQKNEARVEQLRASMDTAALMFCVRSEGITANEMSELRQAFPEDVHIQVAKNSLIKIAASAEGIERFSPISGDELDINRFSNMWFFVPEDKMRESVEVWNKQSKGFARDSNEIVGGAFDGTLLDGEGVDTISKLPTKQELMQQVAVATKMQITSVARVVKEISAAQRLAKGIKEAQGQKMARAIAAMKDKLE